LISSNLAKIKLMYDFKFTKIELLNMTVNIVHADKRKLYFRPA